MSAETIPSDVATDLDCIRWYVECLDAVAFKRRAVAGLAEAEGSYNAAMKRLADRSTRPAEPAAPVAEAGDGDVAASLAHLNIGYLYGIADALEHTDFTRAGDIRQCLLQVVKGLSASAATLEAERARADELRRERDAAENDLGIALDRKQAFRETVDRVWKALGSPAFETLGGESISEVVAGLVERVDAAEAELAASGRCIDDLTARLAAAEQRAADALARAEKAEDWQPIRTAPMGKNGIAFMMLAFGPPGDQTVSEGMHFNGRFYAASVFHQVNPSDGRHFAFREHEVRPTHWRPTLAPPRASREAQPATDGGDNG